MEILNVRRSGRLYERRKNDQIDFIDLSDTEWDDEGVVFDGEDNSLVENMDVDAASNKEARKQSGSNGNPKAANPTDNKDGEKPKKTLSALGEKVKKKLDVKSPVKRVVGKIAKSVRYDKGKRKLEDVEKEAKGNKNGACDAGEDSDDDFVSNKHTKINKVNKKMENRGSPNDKKGKKRGVRVDARKGNGRKNMGDARMGSVKDKHTKAPKERVTIRSRNPPFTLFRVITQMNTVQKQDVIDIGFGELLAFKIHKIPTRLCFWLLERFDADTCTLNLNSKPIVITREVVRDTLGIPIGDVHIDARDETDHRNPLTKEWKAQFPLNLKRHYATRVANYVLENEDSGYMFKLNFLVLLFTAIGDWNLSNTVNLKFLPCINSEDDIPKLDWCTYMIQCLTKTKRSWDPNGYFNGPIILLLVLYARSETPLKIWSTDLLMKLEADMFPNDDVSDTGVGEESENTGVDEMNLDKDDEFEGCDRGIMKNDLEGIKKYVSTYLKKARKMIDKADEMLDHGFESSPNDTGLLELKKMRDQMFEARKYAQQPTNNEQENDQMHGNCYTPENRGNKQTTGNHEEGVMTFTQEAILLSDRVWEEFERKNQPVPVRLDFDDDCELDLNVTQPPATQGKVVSDKKDTDGLEDDQALLESLINYDSQEPVHVNEFTTPSQPIGSCPGKLTSSGKLSRFGRESLANRGNAVVPLCDDPKPLKTVYPAAYGGQRVKRQPILPEVFRSPYVIREVELTRKISPPESIVAACLFSGRLPANDIVFKTPFVDGERVVLETLYPKIEVAAGLIDIFTHVLNDAEKQRNKSTVKRVFCHTSMMTSEMIKWEYERALHKFTENMNSVLERSVYKNLRDVDLVFFPVLKESHFFVVCVNLKYNQIQIMDNIFSSNPKVEQLYAEVILMLIPMFEDYLRNENNPHYNSISAAETSVLPLGCRTTNNYVDCGVFSIYIKWYLKVY